MDLSSSPRTPAAAGMVRGLSLADARTDYLCGRINNPRVLVGWTYKTDRAGELVVGDWRGIATRRADGGQERLPTSNIEVKRKNDTGGGRRYDGGVAGMKDRLELGLRDGTPVIVRPLVEEDRAAAAEAYRRLSPEARYQRFWTRTGEMIGDAMLDKLIRQDAETHMTWAVLDPARDFPPVGGASWWRSVENPDEAEISAMVLDDDQGRGVGTLLLAVMWLTAYRAGVGHLVGYTLTENRRAANWMRDCGGKGVWDGYKLAFRWDLADLEALPETPAAADLAAWLAELAPVLL